MGPERVPSARRGRDVNIAARRFSGYQVLSALPISLKVSDT